MTLLRKILLIWILVILVVIGGCMIQAPMIQVSEEPTPIAGMSVAEIKEMCQFLEEGRRYCLESDQFSSCVNNLYLELTRLFNLDVGDYDPAIKTSLLFHDLFVICDIGEF